MATLIMENMIGKLISNAINEPGAHKKADSNQAGITTRIKRTR